MNESKHHVGLKPINDHQSLSSLVSTRPINDHQNYGPAQYGYLICLECIVSCLLYVGVGSVGPNWLLN